MDWLGDGSCDDGSSGIDFNCEEFEYDHGDCNEKVKTDNECANTCYGASCDFWLFVGDYTCDHLESYWGCNCNGCTCCRTDCQGKLCAHHSNKLNDGHCDDGCDGQCLDFNCDKFHFDQGDCPNATTTKTVVPVASAKTAHTKVKRAKFRQSESSSAFLVVGIVCIVLVLMLILATCILCVIARRVMRPVTPPTPGFPSMFGQYLGRNQSGEQTPVAEEVDFSGCNMELSYVAPSSNQQTGTREESVSDTDADAVSVGGGGDGGEGGDVEINGYESGGSDQGDVGVA